MVIKLVNNSHITDNVKILKTNHPLIVSFENFIKEETINKILSEFNNQNIWEYNIDIDSPKEIKNVLLNSEFIDQHETINFLVLNLCDVISEYFGETYCSVKPSVRRWEKGEIQFSHMDNIEPDGKIPFTRDKDFYPYPIIDLTAIIYLNDNYLGGEIFFPKKNIEIKPKAGSILVWPASEYHSVKEVMSDYRYTIICFLIKARTLAAFQSYKLSEDWQHRIINSSVVDNFLPNIY
jgi:hypothetical protein